MASVAERMLSVVKMLEPGILDVEIGILGDPTSVRVFPSQHQTAVQGAINAFNWSVEAHAVWEANQHPERKSLRDQAAQATNDNDTFLAIGNPTNAQILAQVRRLTQQNTRIIRRLVQID